MLFNLFTCSSFFSGGKKFGTNYVVQQSLFDLYDFEIIPVELISSIYENFIGNSDENDDLIGDMAPFKMNLGLLYNYKNKITIYPKVNYVSVKKTINWQGDPTVDPIFTEIEGYAIIGLNINVLNMFGVVKGLDFYLKIDNLTNKDYYNPGPRGADGVKYTARVQQPGMNMMAGIAYTF